MRNHPLLCPRINANINNKKIFCVMRKATLQHMRTAEVNQRSDRRRRRSLIYQEHLQVCNKMEVSKLRDHRDTHTVSYLCFVIKSI